MQNTQRAYFYQRFPILHLEPGDWLWSGGPRVWCIQACASALFRTGWLFLPASALAPGLPGFMGRFLLRPPVAGLLKKARQWGLFGYLRLLVDLKRKMSPKKTIHSGPSEVAPLRGQLPCCVAQV